MVCFMHHSNSVDSLDNKKCTSLIIMIGNCVLKYCYKDMCHDIFLF